MVYGLPDEGRCAAMRVTAVGFQLSCSYLDFARLSMWLDGFIYRPRARVAFSDLAVACRLAQIEADGNRSVLMFSTGLSRYAAADVPPAVRQVPVQVRVERAAVRAITEIAEPVHDAKDGRRATPSPTCFSAGR